MNLQKYKISRVLDEMDMESKLPLKRRKMSKQEDMEAINPQYKSSKASSSNNCLLSTVAYDMRRRGFDVIARQNAAIDLLYDVDPEDILWVYPKAKHIKTGSVNNLIHRLSQEPDGSRGGMFCSWKGGHGGHAVAYEIENGKPIIYDAQTATRYQNVRDLFYDCEKTSFIRLDNLNPDWVRVGIMIE